MVTKHLHETRVYSAPQFLGLCKVLTHFSDIIVPKTSIRSIYLLHSHYVLGSVMNIEIIKTQFGSSLKELMIIVLGIFKREFMR